jgi:hypothetical protein
MDLLKIRPTSSLADQERYPAALRVSAKKSTEESCREIAEKALADLGSLPATKTFELYLIRALAEINIDGIDQLAVIYPPEFLFLLDAGLESLVGVSVPWENVVRGDPTFPDFGRASLYSVASRGIGDLIFPMIPGSIIIGIKDGTSEEQVKRELTAAGLKDVEVFGFFAAARCKPFEERSVGAKLEATVSFVKYAGPNRLVRLIDFDPGWTADRLI